MAARSVSRTLSTITHFLTPQNLCHKCVRNCATSANQRWQLLSAVCLERHPVVVPDLIDMELKYKEMVDKMEFENSLLSDHELQFEKDEKMAKKDKHECEEDKIEKKTLTALDLEDMWEVETQAFKPASCRTEADEKDDLTSIKRKLQESLILIVKQQIVGKEYWVLPQGEWQQGETMREAAERVLSNSCGTNIKAHFIGKAPCGIFKDKFPSKLAQEKELGGNKVFFFKAAYNGGHVLPNQDNIKEYLWVTKQELVNYFSPLYAKCVNEFLPDL